MLGLDIAVAILGLVGFHPGRLTGCLGLLAQGLQRHLVVPGVVNAAVENLEFIDAFQHVAQLLQLLVALLDAIGRVVDVDAHPQDPASVVGHELARGRVRKQGTRRQLDLLALFQKQAAPQDELDIVGPPVVRLLDALGDLAVAYGSDV